MSKKIAGRGPVHNITSRSLKKERRAVRRGLVIFWLFVIGGTVLAIYIATF